MTKKVRIAPKATKGKGKKWKRGESSSCNAENHKFREKVDLIRQFSDKSSASSEIDYLGIDRLNLASLVQNDQYEKPMDIDQESLASATSCLSVFSNCSNETFSKLVETWDPTSYMHREMAALLATITETIKEQGGKENETEYFAILLTLLEGAEKPEELTAIAYLLHIVIKKLPIAVKKLKFTEIHRALAKIIEKSNQVENSYLIISIIKCLNELLKCQDLSVWQLPSTRNVFEIILNFTQDSKPRIRKNASRCVVNILKASSIVWGDNACHHIMTPVAVDFCIEKIKMARLSPESFAEALHMVNLLRDIIIIVPQEHLKKCCETILRIIHIEDPIVISCGLKVFLSLFSSSSPLRALSAKQNESLLEALRNRKPNLAESDLLALWIMVIKEGYLSLYSIDKEKCLRRVSILFTDLIECCQNDSKLVQSTTSSSIFQVIQSVIAPSINDIGREIILDIIETFTRSLDFKYQVGWGSICQMIETFIRFVGPNITQVQLQDQIKNLLKLMVDLREGFNPKVVSRIDTAVSTAVKVLGPSIVINACPIDVDLYEKSEFSHSWLLPLLRENISNTTMRTFWNYFYPLARKLDAKRKQAESEKNIQAKVFSLLYEQIWSLFPSFCKSPSDIKTALTKEYAKLLYSEIEQNTVIRNHCLAGLRNCVRTCNQPEERAILTRYSRNYLPLLFTIFINPEKATSRNKEIPPVFETIKTLLEIAEDDQLRTHFQKIMERLNNFDGDRDLRLYLMDLLTIFIPHLKSLEDLKLVMDSVIILSVQNNEEPKWQKKGFKLMKELCKSTLCKDLIESNECPLVAILLNRISDSTIREVKPWPLITLKILCERELLQINESLLGTILPYIVRCLEIGNSFCKKVGLDFFDSLTKYLPRVKIMTVLEKNLTQVLNEPKPSEVMVYGRFLVRSFEELSKEVKARLFSMLDLFKSKNRMIIRALLQVISLWLKTLPREEVFPSVSFIINGFDLIPEEHKKALYKDVKIILTKLIRKFSYEHIVKLCPASLTKVVKNIKKLETTKKRSQKEEDDNDSSVASTKQTKSVLSIDDILRDSSDESSDGEEMISLKSARSVRSQRSRKSLKSSRSVTSRSGTWIEEGEDEVLDLMAPDANRKIRSTNPHSIPKSKKDSSFSMTEDGKIIVGAEDSLKGSKRKRNIQDDEQDNEVEDNQTEIVSKIKTGYKPGGKGIHRPLKKKKSSALKGVKLGQEYRGKKAKGDMKKSNAPDPYAYIPLSGAMLNKRKKNKYKGVLKKVM